MTIFGIEHQKMNMVGRYCVIEDYQSIALFRLIQPLDPALTILAYIPESNEVAPPLNMIAQRILSVRGRTMRSTRTPGRPFCFLWANVRNSNLPSAFPLTPAFPQLG